jgi:hypothetical protein
MNDPVDLAGLDPSLISEFLNESVRAELRVVGVIKDDVARRQEMRFPGVEVPPNPFVRVIAVKPQKAHRLAPSGRQDLAADIEETHVPVSPGTNHVAEERRPVLRPELTAARSCESLMRLDGKDRRTAAGSSTVCESDGRATPIAADLDDAAVCHLTRQVVQQDGDLPREPTPDGRNITKLLRPLNPVRWQPSPFEPTQLTRV